MTRSKKICANASCGKTASRKSALHCELCGGTEFVTVESNEKPKPKVIPRKHLEEQLEKALLELEQARKENLRLSTLDALEKETEGLQDSLYLSYLQIQDLTSDIISLQYQLNLTNNDLDQTLDQLQFAKDDEFAKQKGKEKVKRNIIIVILLAALIVSFIFVFFTSMELTKIHEKREKERDELSQILDDTRDKNDQLIKEKDKFLTDYNELSEKYNLLQFKLDSVPTPTPSPTPTFSPSPAPTTLSLNWISTQQFNISVIVPKPTTMPTSTPEPTSTQVTTINGKWTPFCAGDTVTGWAISINGHYFEYKYGVVLYDSPLDGHVIGEFETPGIINPYCWEITNQKLITREEVFQ